MAKKRIDLKVLKNLKPLGQLGGDKLSEIAEKSVQDEYPAGRILFRQGERDKRTMYVLSGQIELSSSGKSRTTIIKGKSPEASNPLAPELPRTCTARTRTNATILFVDNDLLEILLADDQSGIHSYEVTEISAESDGGDWMLRFLQSRAFLNLPTENIQTLLMRMEEVAAKKGEAVIRQGESDDYYYIIKSGSCDVSRRPAPKANDVKLATLTHGEGFGEEALITQGKRNASVTMAEDGVVMRVHRDDFIPLLVEPLIHAVDEEHARQLLAAGSKLIDVRTHHEFSRDGLERAANIPLSMLRSKLGSLDPIHNYLLYCDDGTRSSAAAFLLSQQGLQCSILKGGLGESGGALPRKSKTTQSAEPVDEPLEPSPQTPMGHSAPDLDIAPTQTQAPVAHTAPDLDLPAHVTQAAAAVAPAPKAPVAAPRAQVQKPAQADLKRGKAKATSERLQREAEALKNRSRNLAQRTASAEAAQREAEQELERIKQEEQNRRATQLGAAKKRVEEEMRRARSAEQARKQAEAARLKAEEEARRIQAQSNTLRDNDLKQARQRAEEEARRSKAAQLASQKAMQDAQRARTEAETLRQQSQQEIERLRVEAEATRRKAEQELERVRAEAEEAARRQAALEEERKRAGEEAAQAARAAELARRESEQEAGRLRAEAEAIRQQARQEADQMREQMELTRREMAEEAARLRAEAERAARERAEAEEAARMRAAEEEAARARAEAEQAAQSRAAAEGQLQRAREEAEEAARRIKAEAEEVARARAEAEATLASARAEASALKQRAAEELQARRRAAAEKEARRVAEQDEARRTAAEEARRVKEAERAARREAEAAAAARHKALQEAAARKRAEEAEAARQAALRKREEERARRARQLAAEAQAKQLAEAIVGQLQDAERARQEQAEREVDPGLSLSGATVRQVKGRTILEGDEDIFVFQPPRSGPPGTEESVPELSEAQAVESLPPVNTAVSGSTEEELPSFIIETDEVTVSMDTRRVEPGKDEAIFEFGDDSDDEDPASVIIDTSAPVPNRGVTATERFAPQHSERRGGKAWWGIAAGVLLVGALGYFALTQKSYVDVQQVATWFGDEKTAARPAADDAASLETRRLAQFASARRQAEKVARDEAESEYNRLLAVWKTRIAPGLTERRSDETPASPAAPVEETTQQQTISVAAQPGEGTAVENATPADDSTGDTTPASTTAGELFGPDISPEQDAD